MNRIKSIALGLLVFTIGALQAQEENVSQPFGFLIEGALEFGGDEIAEVFFQNGEDQSVNAGQGGSIAVGGQYALDKLLIRGTVGWKYVTTQASDANIRLTRVPLNLSLNYLVTPDIRIGAGIQSQQSIKFKGDNIPGLPDIDFGSATGPRIEVAYKWIGISYTSMTYKSKDVAEEYKADSFGITLSYVFGQ